MGPGRRAFGRVLVSLAGLLVCFPNMKAQTISPQGKAIDGSFRLAASIKPEIKAKLRLMAWQSSGTTKIKIEKKKEGKKTGGRNTGKNNPVKNTARAQTKTGTNLAHATPVSNPASVPPAPSPPPAITYFFQDTKDWLRAGEVVHVTLLGTAGGQAAFHVGALPDSIPMQESAPGTYIGTWTVPTGKPLLAMPVTVNGELRVGGKAALSMQTARPVCVDMMAPTAQNFLPAPGTILAAAARLIISADLADQGSGIDPSSVHLLLNGHDITGQANITSERVEYKPLTPPGTGEQTVQISASDRAGNKFEHAWRFTITTP